MKVLIQQIQLSLLHMPSSVIESLPGIVFAIAILVFTRYVANIAKRVAAITGKRILKSQSLRSRA